MRLAISGHDTVINSMKHTFRVRLEPQGPRESVCRARGSESVTAGHRAFPTYPADHTTHTREPVRIYVPGLGSSSTWATAKAAWILLQLSLDDRANDPTSILRRPNRKADSRKMSARAIQYAMRALPEANASQGRWWRKSFHHGTARGGRKERG